MTVVPWLRAAESESAPEAPSKATEEEVEEMPLGFGERSTHFNPFLNLFSHISSLLKAFKVCFEAEEGEGGAHADAGASSGPATSASIPKQT